MLDGKFIHSLNCGKLYTLHTVVLMEVYILSYLWEVVHSACCGTDSSSLDGKFIHCLTCGRLYTLHTVVQILVCWMGSLYTLLTVGSCTLCILWY